MIKVLNRRTRCRCAQLGVAGTRQQLTRGDALLIRHRGRVKKG